MRSKFKPKDSRGAPRARPSRPVSSPASGEPKLTARLVKIGNSRGIRLPKAVIEQAGLGEKVELSVRGNEVVLRAASANSRAGWDEAFRRAFAKLPADFLEREREEFADLQNLPNDFDEKDWT